MDDDRSVADTFARMLKLEGFGVATALSAEAGLELAETSTRTPSSSTCGCRSRTGCSFSDSCDRVRICRCAGRDRDRRLLSPRVHPARAEVARRVHPLQTALARRSDRAGQDPGLGVNDRFLQACRREPVDATPVWFMRQAGRYMSDYRALRERYSLLDICRAARAGGRGHAAAGRRHRRRCGDPVLRSADSVHADGARLRFRQGRRPGDRATRFAPPPTSIACRRSSRARRSAHVLETIRMLRARARRSRAAHRLRRRALHARGLRDRRRTLDDLRAHEGVHVCAAARVASPLRSLRRVIADYLTAQVEAGVQALQIFDSWAGALGRADYREFALPHTSRIFAALAEHRRAGQCTSASARRRSSATSREAGGDVIGLDWRLPLDEAWARHRPRPRRSGQPRSDAAAGSARTPVRRGRRCAATRRRPARPHLQSGPRRAAETSLEQVQALAKHSPQDHARAEDAETVAREQRRGPRYDRLRKRDEDGSRNVSV